jgi:hypothetical protein
VPSRRSFGPIIGALGQTNVVDAAGRASASGWRRAVCRLPGAVLAARGALA